MQWERLPTNRSIIVDVSHSHTGYACHKGFGHDVMHQVEILPLRIYIHMLSIKVFVIPGLLPYL